MCITQKWKGAALNLKKKPTKIKIRASWINIHSFAWLTCSICAKNIENASKFVNPVNPYKSEQPRTKIPDEKAPNKKYFNPASVENSESLWDAART